MSDKQDRKKAAKKYLKTAAQWIRKGNQYEKESKNFYKEGKTKKAEERKKWAKDWYAKAKEYIKTTKDEQRLSYDLKDVYGILAKAAKEKRDEDNSAVTKVVKNILEKEIFED